MGVVLARALVLERMAPRILGDAPLAQIAARQRVARLGRRLDQRDQALLGGREVGVVHAIGLERGVEHLRSASASVLTRALSICGKIASPTSVLSRPMISTTAMISISVKPRCVAVSIAFACTS